jgi:hypothetical protein
MVRSRVLLPGLILAFGTVGFATLASFTTLYYASRHWIYPARAGCVWQLLCCHSFAICEYHQSLGWIPHRLRVIHRGVGGTVHFGVYHNSRDGTCWGSTQREWVRIS